MPKPSRHHRRFLSAPTSEDRTTLALMAATLICVTLGAVFNRTSIILAGITPLIIAIAWTSLTDKHDLDRQFEQIRRAVG